MISNKQASDNLDTMGVSMVSFAYQVKILRYFSEPKPVFL